MGPTYNRMHSMEQEIKEGEDANHERGEGKVVQ